MTVSSNSWFSIVMMLLLTLGALVAATPVSHPTTLPDSTSSTALYKGDGVVCWGQGPTVADEIIQTGLTSFCKASSGLPSSKRLVSQVCDVAHIYFELEWTGHGDQLVSATNCQAAMLSIASKCNSGDGASEGGIITLAEWKYAFLSGISDISSAAIALHDHMAETRVPEPASQQQATTVVKETNQTRSSTRRNNSACWNGARISDGDMYGVIDSYCHNYTGYTVGQHDTGAQATIGQPDGALVTMGVTNLYCPQGWGIGYAPCMNLFSILYGSCSDGDTSPGGAAQYLCGFYIIDVD